MKTFIFYSMPGHGHTNPTLTIARDLAKRGNRVIYYSIKEFRERIEAAEVEYRSYNMKYYFDPIISRSLSALARKLMENSDAMTSELIEEAEQVKPDCILYDSLSFWGKLIGNSLRVPSISLFTTFAINNTIGKKYSRLYVPVLAKSLLQGKSGFEAYRLYVKLCRKYKLTPEKTPNFLLIKDKLNLVFTSTYLQPCSDSFGNTFKFTGPSIFPRHDNADFLKNIHTNKKVIYLSMGTIFNDNLQFFKQCITLFGKTEYQVIISLGHRFSENHLPEIPSNIIIRNYVPQLEVLQKTDLFITHAGLNSINESLFYGVPMILIPQMYEQMFNAFRVQELGAGIYLRQNQLNPGKILESIHKIISSDSFYKNAEKIQKTLEDAGGYKKATDEILAYLKK